MIYLDNAATTQVFERAADAAVKAMRIDFFNPNATYGAGVAIKSDIEENRRTIARALGVSPDELFFTSGATEANNWVFKCGIKNRKGNVVISAGEHSSVYEPAMRLKSDGTDVRIVGLKKDGVVDLDELSRAVDANTTLVSIIHVSNETGVVNPIEKAVSIIKARAPRALIHSDGVQAALKLKKPIGMLGVDLYTVGAHKLGAPKGVGLLYAKKPLVMSPMIMGGGQESGRRSGTQNTPYIAAFAAAVTEFSRIEKDNDVASVRKKLCDTLVRNGCEIIGNEDQNSGYIACVYVPNVKAEILQNLVFERGVVIGKGAACSGSKRGNRVLKAMGLDDKKIECCVRISLFVNSEEADVMAAADIIIDAAQKIRSNNVG